VSPPAFNTHSNSNSTLIVVFERERENEINKKQSNTVDAQKEEGRLHIPKGRTLKSESESDSHHLLQAIEPRAQKSLLF